MRSHLLGGILGVPLAILGFSEVHSENVTDPDLTELKMLMNAKVTSVTKTPQRFFDSAAAVFVISQQDIRRSGATNVAEALRMVPGLHVARLDSNRWGITARGFNGRFANKMLVLLDGRTVYTPAFSGTYWETLDLVMTDIE